MACKKLGITEVPCVRLDHLTDEQRREYAIAHNATAELSEWDFGALGEELAELDLGEFDFEFDLEETPEGVNVVEDEVPEVDTKEPPIVQRGQIWQLGRHRLMCGDSTDAECVKKLMGGRLADLLLTDPPLRCGLRWKNQGRSKNRKRRKERFGIY